jgi:isopentenyl-diphosphate delta-isomerase
MGFTTALAAIGTFQYRAELDSGLVENELVHLFSGRHDGPVAADPFECDGYSWMAPDAIIADVAERPGLYTEWFKKYVDARWPLIPPTASGPNPPA